MYIHIPIHVFKQNPYQNQNDFEPTTLMLIFLLFSYADIKELIFEYHNHYGVIVMLLQTKGKFFSKPNLIFNLILYYMLFLKQSKLAPQCSPQQHATPSSKPSRSPLLFVLGTKVYCPDIYTTNPNLPCCRLPLWDARERERGFNNYSCKIL